ncbi:MAG TPA: GNAT family N-acetyltransferase [Candidatus Limnocylindrales bacterium]|nr:GNAT family N-acetyltransferase [Candidatus Limnocylindrales bacterium]
MLAALGWIEIAAYANVARTMSHAAPIVSAATRGGAQRRMDRENGAMPGVSQELLRFANTNRQPAAPGIEVIETPRYRIVLQPDFPVPGPNSVSWIRCRSEEAGALIDEVRSIVAPRHIPLMWTLDPDTEPVDFAGHLAARGVHPDPRAPQVAVMVLPIDVSLDPPDVGGLELHDALADLDAFRKADSVNVEAFTSRQPVYDPGQVATLERRRRNQLAAGNRRVILATVDGEPAGSAGLSLFPPSGAIINGGGVRAKFRGRGVYRAMVVARLQMARAAGVAGITVWGANTSAPILARLGFETVGWRKFYLDESTA